MMIRKSLLLKFFQGAYIQRWNDKLRPIDFIESDKHGHKMIIAYFLAMCEERVHPINWIYLIEGGIFEYVQKIVLTDLKSPVFYIIKANAEKYQRLNEFVYKDIYPFIEPLGQDFCARFRDYFLSDESLRERRILSAASALSSKWEFDIIAHADPHGYENEQIKMELQKKTHEYADLAGMQDLSANPSSRSFIDLCGQLRYQARWAHVHRIPKTSVLSHCFFVAIISYLYTLQVNGCSRRGINNFFGGLFHDLPEVLTRDIISPVKRSVDGLRDLIIEYEKRQMDKIVYPLLPQDFHANMRLYTETDDVNCVTIDGALHTMSLEEINREYNDNRYNAFDGEIVKAADDISALIEAHEAIHNGCVDERFRRAHSAILAKYESLSLGGITFRDLAVDFVS